MSSRSREQWVRRGAVVALLAGLLGAGGARAQVEGTPLRIWVGSETDARYYMKMAELYRQKRKPDFAAEVNAFGYTEMPDKLAAAIKTGANPPDVVQLDQIFFGIYLSGEVPFLDLTERVRKAGLESKILEARQELFKWRGRTYGLPQSVSAVLLYWRQDLFAKHGVRPGDIETWEKLRAAGERVKKAGGPSLLSLDWSYFEILLRQRGQDLFDAQGQPQLTTPKALSTLRFLVELQRSRAGLQPDRGSIFEPSFFAGDVAHDEAMAIVGADWYGLDMIQGMAPAQAGKWQAAPLPAWDGEPGPRTSVFAGEGLLVYRDTKRVEEAWEFVRFVMEDPDANVERYLQGNCFPAFRPAWTDPRLAKPEAYFGGQSVATLVASLAPTIPKERASPLKAPLVNLWREKYWSAVMRGTVPPEQALREIQDELLRLR
jgi:ABC-type glycerol-3-phosphate transport system substrate-binding protein